MTASEQHSAYPMPGIDYPWIVAWNSYCSAEPRDLDDQLRLAHVHAAPATAVRKERFNAWTLLEDIDDEHARQFFLDWGADYGIPVPDRVIRLWVSPEAAATRRHRYDFDASAARD